MFILVFSNPASSLLFILHIFPKLRLCAKVSPPRPLAQSRPSYWVPQWNASICWCVLTSSVKLVLRCMSYKQHAFLWLEKFFQIKSPLQELGSVSDLASRLLLKTIQNISKERSQCALTREHLCTQTPTTETVRRQHLILTKNQIPITSLDYGNWK